MITAVRYVSYGTVRLYIPYPQSSVSVKKNTFINSAKYLQNKQQKQFSGVTHT